MPWTVEHREIRAPQADALAERLGKHERVSVFGDHGSGKTSLLLAVAERLHKQAIVVAVPRQLDNIQSTLLDIARQIGPAALGQAEEVLMSDGGEPTRALSCIGEHLGDRVLMFDDVDHLRPGTYDDAAWAFARHARALKRWISTNATLVTSSRRAYRFEPLAPATEPPYVVMTPDVFDTTALWERVGRQPLKYRLTIARALLTESFEAFRRSFDNIDQLLSVTWVAIPLALQEAITVLAIHERPMQRELLSHVLSREADASLQEAARTLVIDVGPSEVRVPYPWTRWVRSRVPNALRSTLHRRLAQVFEQAAQRDPRFVLEAHRHFLGSGDVERARTLARFGPRLLMAHARELSLEQHYPESARVYELVLQLDESLRRNTANGIGNEPRAYATHYVHYNRAKAALESIQLTQRGYENALETWPTNALFWSRLILTRFLAGDWDGALEATRAADFRVPSHPNKTVLLVSRTVTKLLARSLVQEGLVVWGARIPRSPAERIVFTNLLSRARDGWSTRDARGTANHVRFHHPVTISINSRAEGYACSLLELDLTGHGPSPVEALDSVLAAVRQEVLALAGEFTHTLSAERKLRKRTLLAWVDVIASGISTPPKFTWALGRIAVRDGSTVFISGDATLIVPPDCVAQPDESFWFARVSQGANGELLGPIDKLERASPDDPDIVWSKWAALVGEKQ